MFQLTREEFSGLTSQNAISKDGRGGRRTPPYAFTEHGAVMAANILRSDRAVQYELLLLRSNSHYDHFRSASDGEAAVPPVKTPLFSKGRVRGLADRWS